VSEDVGTTGTGDAAAARRRSARQEAEHARTRAEAAGARARELAAGAPADPRGAAERSVQAWASLAASLRSAAEAHRRAARTHADAADLGSGDPGGHRAEAETHLRLAGEDDARAEVVERDVRPG
jgi:hypothetical protein